MPSTPILPKADIIVLLPHYNDNARLKESVASIKEPIPVDLFIVDDGSAIKPSEQELQKLHTNGKVTVFLLEKNVGPEKVRNYGLELISGLGYKYIASMDSDDRNKENRFYKQWQHLEADPDVKLLGAWCDCVDANGNFLYTQKYPTDYEDIKKKMYINSMFAHPTLVLRTEILKTIGFYPENYKCAEDYAYIFKIMAKYKVENYPEALIYYTINEKGVSSMRRRTQVTSRLKIIRDNFYFGFYPIYGLFRNIPLLFLSRRFLTTIKAILKRH